MVDFIEEFEKMAPLTGEVYTIDKATVHTNLKKYLPENDTALSKISAIDDEINGREYFMLLKAHYEGVGVNTIDITKVEKKLSDMFYSRERHPHLWWKYVEKQLTFAFTMYNKREGRIVHSNDIQMRIFLNKINANFLTTTKVIISVELSRIPMIYTYEQAIVLFRDTVNDKFTPKIIIQKRT